MSKELTEQWKNGFNSTFEELLQICRSYGKMVLGMKRKRPELPDLIILDLIEKDLKQLFNLMGIKCTKEHK